MSASGPVPQPARSAKDIAQLTAADMMRFSKLLLDRCGLHFSDNRRTELEHGIRQAFASSTCPSLDEFYTLIVNQPNSVEMDILVNAVTVSETHFFRDAAQFNALTNSIFPQIIKRKTSLRTLRIWSAGCASGEEPYSIAMLLRNLIPDVDDWAITILATDINASLLEKARTASYGQWAFREERAISMRSRYFHPNGNRFELSSQIKRMVVFSRLNLMESNYPSFETNTMMMDLIICRNVTIYFPEAVTRQVVGKFHSALVNGGWLIVGHSEPSLEIYNQFQPRNFPDTVVYQRDDNAKPAPPALLFPMNPATLPPPKAAADVTPFRPAPLPRVTTSPLSNPPAGEKPAESLARARELLDFGRDQDALTVLEKLLEADPRNAQIYTLLGRIYANRGAWEKAEKHCRKAMELDKLILEAYYTLGLVLQHQKRLPEAIDFMKKVIYLDRNHILGHYHLGGLYREQGLLPNAQKSLDNALNLLRNLPADEMIPDSGGITVNRLRDAILHQQQTLNKV